MRAEDLLPDEQNRIELAGTVIRKGTVGAFLMNAAVWLDPHAGVVNRSQAEADLQAALPALRALGLFEVLEVRDAALRQWLATR
ncbi:hypothetical protein [Silvimonas amylolytica]|uniref:Preprotein translocase subunit SecD n=1 Tax=Silvimonas amylolytica TaxID=449663 RepID=A0ABQ2PQP4_9NEIS|nr:hypothetical protein [Silvimonas amylolytica]GGP27950.1 hypothetical protein GCM10010971_37690 [Silvimonas amylolytica]